MVVSGKLLCVYIEAESTLISGD